MPIVPLVFIQLPPTKQIKGTDRNAKPKNMTPVMKNVQNLATIKSSKIRKKKSNPYEKINKNI